MSEPFLGEIRIVSFNFPPNGWALCNGQLLPISQNAALFSILGTTYGGDGRSTFALPNLQGRTPVHPDYINVSLGQTGGENSHKLLLSEIPAHNHAMLAASHTAVATLTNNHSFAEALQNPPGPAPLYGSSTSIVGSDSRQVKVTGHSDVHANTQPTLILNFIIALQGIYPSRN